jgi:preprotein translocase subunit YajC
MDSNVTLVIVYVAIGGVFYFLWFRPQQTARKKAIEMLAALAPGDRVMTAGGLEGKIKSIDDDMLDIEIADGVIARFTKRAIIERLTEEITPVDE